MWLARNPEQSSPDKRSFEEAAGEVIRRGVVGDLPPCGQYATWPHERAEGPATACAE
jgi:hypothetical protein